MKNSGIAIYLLFLAPVVLTAQAPSAFGLKSGITLSSQSVVYHLPDEDFQIESEGIVAPAVFFFMEFRGKDRWGIQADAGYTVAGSKTSTESLTVFHLEDNRIIENKGETSEVRFRYLSLSPRIRYKLMPGKLCPYLLAGPRIDFQLGYDNGTGYDLSDQHKIIPGLSAGGGIEYLLGKFSIFAEALIQANARPLMDTEAIIIRNHAAEITLGLRYNRRN